MKSISIPHTLVDRLEKDFNAEVVAAEMLEQGVAADRILILLTGALSRPHGKDVRSLDEETSDYDHKEYLIVKTTREGIYDMLPEGLFHPLTAHKSAKTEKEIIATMKQRKKEEQNARMFFLPFEATINYLRMQIAFYENKLDKRAHYDELVNIFSDNWEIFQWLDARQSNIFLHLVPIIYDLRDDMAAAETIFGMMFLLPVRVQLKDQLPIHPSRPILSKLGESTLGVDLTTGNEVYNEGTEEIIINIGPLNNKGLLEFMEGGKNQKILELLCDYLLPAHVDITIEFELELTDRNARLRDGINDHNCVLGANTYL